MCIRSNVYARVNKSKELIRQNALPKEGALCGSHCRGGGIRTHDLFVPNEARYQAAPHPDRPPHQVLEANLIKNSRYLLG